MIGILFTLDYEIHGNGDGSPRSLMVNPTNKIMKLFDLYGAKLTIMADVGEILKFKEYDNKNRQDKFNYRDIEKQLKYAVEIGHDVQLHIHSSYFNSEYKNNKFHQNWDEYNLAELSYNRIYEIIHICKTYLESILTPVKSNYRCFAFRAANWSMSPSLNIVKALKANNILIDTSVFKYGKRNGRVRFDYSDACSDVIPWPVDVNNVCNYDPNSNLFEFPIYCNSRNLFSFITLSRIYRIIDSARHRHAGFKNNNNIPKSNLLSNPPIFLKAASQLLNKHAWKLDFNQCTGRQLIDTVKKIYQEYENIKFDIPIILIGHSKLYTKYNRIALESFLKYIMSNNHKYYFATFNDFDLQNYNKRPVKQDHRIL